MQREIVFDGGSGRDRERFVLLYQGFVTGGNTVERKGIEALRREADLMRKFEAVSTRPPDLPHTIEGVRELKPGRHVLALDAPQYEMVKQYLGLAPWRTSAAVRAVDMIDWFEAIPATTDGDGKAKRPVRVARAGGVG